MLRSTLCDFSIPTHRTMFNYFEHGQTQQQLETPETCCAVIDPWHYHLISESSGLSSPCLRVINPWCGSTNSSFFIIGGGDLFCCCSCLFARSVAFFFAVLYHVMDPAIPAPYARKTSKRPRYEREGDMWTSREGLYEDTPEILGYCLYPRQ